MNEQTMKAGGWWWNWSPKEQCSHCQPFSYFCSLNCSHQPINPYERFKLWSISASCNPKQFLFSKLLMQVPSYPLRLVNNTFQCLRFVHLCYVRVSLVVCCFVECQGGNVLEVVQVLLLFLVLNLVYNIPIAAEILKSLAQRVLPKRYNLEKSEINQEEKGKKYWYFVKISGLMCSWECWHHRSDQG